MTDEQRDALEEYKYCVMQVKVNPCAGTRYALVMAVAECELLGLWDDDLKAALEGE